MRIWRAGAALSLLVLAACGDDAPAPPATGHAPNALIFTQPDGTAFTITPENVGCGPSDYDEAVEVVRIRDITKPYNLIIEAVPDDVTGEELELPVDAGSDQNGPANIIVFYGSKTFEVSTATEEASGTIRVTRASCDPDMLEFDIDATLDSEYSDGDSLEVEGHVMVGG